MYLTNLNTLIGRDEELQHLLDCYEQVKRPPIHHYGGDGVEQRRRQQQLHHDEAAMTPLVALVHGSSGSGKTALVEEFGRRIETQQVLKMEEEVVDDASVKNYDQPTNPSLAITFVSGKVDEYQGNFPYKVVLDALEQIGLRLCEQKRIHGDLLAENETLLKLRRLLQNECKILTLLAPSLAGLAGNEPEQEKAADPRTPFLGHSWRSLRSHQVQDDAMSERLICLAVRSLIREVVRVHPLVWFVDDMQWADRPSLKLLKALVLDDQLAQLFLIAGFRDMSESTTTTSGNNNSIRSDAVANQQSLIDFLSVIPENRKVDVPVGALPLDVVSQLLAKLLSSSLEKVHPLSSFVYSTTKGNAYFTLRYLELLQIKQLVRYNAESLTWIWDMDEFKKPPPNLDSIWLVSDTVTEVASLHIAILPLFVQQLLQIASCLGFLFNEELLRSLLQTCDALLLMGFSQPRAFLKSQEFDDSPGADSLIVEQSDHQNADALYTWALDLAEKDGLIQQTNRSRYYKFSHDQVRETVYKSIGEGKRLSLLHLCIGKHIQKLEVDRYILDAAEHLNRGSSLLVHEMERLELIELNLKASVHAKLRAGVHLMADYLQHASLLVKEPRDWVHSYDLVLEVYSRSAEAEYARGNFVPCQDRIETILAHAKEPDDTIRARYIRIQVFGAQRLFQEAIREVRHLLTQLGEHLPPSNSISVMVEYFMTRRLVKTKSDYDLANLPPITDSRKLWVFRVIEIAIIYAWNCDPAFCSLLYLRGMRATLMYGSTEHTARAYAGYGMMIADMGNEIEGFRFVNLALKQIKDVSAYTPTNVVVYAFLSHLQRPQTIGLEPLLSAYRVGLGAGDLCWGPISLATYSMLYIFCGLPLAPFIMDMQNFGSQMIMCGQTIPLAYILPNLRLAMNLRGETEDPVLLTWKSCKSVLAGADKLLSTDENYSSGIYLHYMKMLNAYILNDLNLAHEAARCAKFGRLPGSTHFSNLLHTFLDGLVFVALYRHTKNRRYLSIITRSIKYLSGLDKKKIANCQGMLALLRAEQASIWIEKEQVRALYDRSIFQFSRSGLIHFAAIANERAGEFMVHCGDEYWAHHYIGRAVALFDEWGAIAKTASMQCKYPFLSNKGCAARSKSVIITIQGQPRFDEFQDRFDPGSSTIETPNNINST